MLTKSYGTYEGDAAVWTSAEGWVLTNGIWHKVEAFTLWEEARLMKESEWLKAYPGAMKTLPKVAFTV